MTVLAAAGIPTAPAGKFVVRDRDVWHTAWNASDDPLRVLEIVLPGEFGGLSEAVALFP
jgi:hypothetical protein